MELEETVKAVPNVTVGRQCAEERTNSDNHKFDHIKDAKGNPCRNIYFKFGNFVKENSRKLRITGIGLLLLGYIAYFICALRYNFGDEGSLRLVGGTILAAWIIGWKVFKITECYSKWNELMLAIYREYNKGKRSVIFRW